MLRIVGGKENVADRNVRMNIDQLNLDMADLAAQLEFRQLVKQDTQLRHGRTDLDLQTSVRGVNFALAFRYSGIHPRALNVE